MCIRDRHCTTLHDLYTKIYFTACMRYTQDVVLHFKNYVKVSLNYKDIPIIYKQNQYRYFKTSQHNNISMIKGTKITDSH